MLGSAKGSVAEALKLVNYGGAEIIKVFDGILSGPDAGARKDMHKLADALTAKDSDTVFGFFSTHLGDHVMERARRAALQGDLVRAEGYARLSSSITERLTVAQAYNLDRKQTMLDILDDVKTAANSG